MYMCDGYGFYRLFSVQGVYKNYNVTVAKLCALIHEKYPDVSDGSVAAILNDSSFDSDYTNLKSAETLLKNTALIWKRILRFCQMKKRLKERFG